MFTGPRRALSGFFSAYSMLAVLALLCVYFSWATYHRESPTGRAGARSVAMTLIKTTPKTSNVVIVSPPDAVDREFAVTLRDSLADAGYRVLDTLQGDPPAVREAMEKLAASGAIVDVVATTQAYRDWRVWDSLRSTVPAFANMEVVAPSAEGRSTFLLPSNLRNIADQIAVIAIIAVGMTMVIITRGIDLSVGSLLALSAVLTAWLIQQAGGANASPGALLGASLAAVTVSGLVGAFSGVMVSRFHIPPFIATLGMMQVASGLAFIVAKGQTLYDIPDSFTWLGRGSSLGLSNAVWLMLFCYGAAHLFMSRTAPGRYIFAVGGNSEASRLSGVSVPRVLMIVYIVSGLTAGIGGVISTSQLKAGAPTYGLMYELYVIAAAVVGGTSLAGGEGRVFGTLIGAFIIAVIQNGMNLMNVEAYTQKVVLGLVILGAVLLDTLRRRQRVRSVERPPDPGTPDNLAGTPTTEAS
ncbi:MAG: ABC transporter permease [Armatimonadetes bacterium]|nr:ABC transporter permease [Armatimonadota bacterium]